MLARSEFIKARVNPKTKVEAKRILKKLGLTMSEAINLFLTQIKLRKGLPFSVKIPNEETHKAMKETDKNIGLVACEDIDDLYKQLEI